MMYTGHAPITATRSGFASTLCNVARPIAGRDDILGNLSLEDCFRGPAL